MMNFSFNRPKVAFQRVAMFTLMLIGLMSINEVSAQSINDWVGNRQLVSEPVAIQRLEPMAANLKQVYLGNSGNTDAVVGNPQTITAEERFVFFTAVIEELRANGRTTKDAVNTVAAQQVAMGIPATKVTTLVSEVLSLLS
jgi:hypothetical protein